MLMFYGESMVNCMWRIFVVFLLAFSLQGQVVLAANSNRDSAEEDSQQFILMTELESDVMGLRDPWGVSLLYGAQIAPHFDAARRGDLDLSSLQALFDASLSAAFYTGDLDIAEDVYWLATNLSEYKGIHEFDSPGVREEHPMEAAYRIALRSGRYDIAMEAANHDAVDADPDRIEPLAESARQPLSDDQSAGPVIMQLSEQDGELHVTSQRVDWYGESFVVAVVSPLCGPSQRAVDAISEAMIRDSKFRDVVSEKVYWVAGQHITPYMDALVRYDREYAEIDIHLAWNDWQWPVSIDLGRTPIFYIVENGRVVDTVLGWPSDTKLEDIKSVLSVHGFFGNK